MFVDMIEDRADIPNAISPNATMVNLSSIIGTSLSGVSSAAVGQGWCFMIDAVSYIAVIASLLAMSVEKNPCAHTGTRVVEEFRAGLSYVSRSSPMRTALTLLALVSTMGMPYTVLMPAIAS